MILPYWGLVSEVFPSLKLKKYQTPCFKSSFFAVKYRCALILIFLGTNLFYSTELDNLIYIFKVAPIHVLRAHFLLKVDLIDAFHQFSLLITYIALLIFGLQRAAILWRPVFSWSVWSESYVYWVWAWKDRIKRF